jgi:predicted nucleic acid-binding protein
MRTPPPGRLRRVLVDTAAYFALVVPQESNHRFAIAVLEGIQRQRAHLFTTNFVIAETHALLLVRRGRAIAARVLGEIDNSATTIVRISSGDERRAREIIRRYDDKDFSLTDAASFAVMERLRIPYAFSFDHHFAQYGFTLLTPGTI